MKKRSGSALLVVVLVTTMLSSLVWLVQYKVSLLMQTVVERESQLKWYNAAQACMFYAIHLAKANWQHMMQSSSFKEGQTYNIRWALDHQRTVPTNIWLCRQDEIIRLKVELYNESGTLQQQISCSIKPIGAKKDASSVNQVMIYDWKEG